MVCASYPERLAHRMLSGDAAATMTVYRDDPTEAIAVLDHFLADDGIPYLVVRAEDVSAAPCAVRLDLGKTALDWAHPVAVASLHALAEVEWLHTLGGARVGRAVLSQAHVHWAGGVYEVDVHRLVPRATPWDNFDGLASVLAWGEDNLSALCAEALAGLGEGTVLLQRPVQLCEHVRDRIIVADVDTAGIVLMALGSQSMSVVAHEFRAPVATHHELVGALDALMLKTSLLG